MEHRCGLRRAVTRRVTLRTRSGVVGTATICEVSASGGRIECPVALPLHSIVILKFTDARGRRESLEAEVIRATDQGYGLEWLEFASHAARALYRPGAPESEEPRLEPAARQLATHSRR
jgi:hypothetical protein